MMSRSILLLVVITSLLYPSKVAVPPAPPPPPEPEYPVADMFEFEPEQEEVAKQVEGRLRDHGFSDELITAALVNAYAESGLNASVIGKAGERGIFQLHPEGLGHSMTVDDMLDVESASDRIAWAVKRNKKIMGLESRSASADTLTAAFCIEIERPSNKHEKAKKRVRLMKKMLIN
jgi:hypothetical protein